MQRHRFLDGCWFFVVLGVIRVVGTEDVIRGDEEDVVEALEAASEALCYTDEILHVNINGFQWVTVGTREVWILGVGDRRDCSVKREQRAAVLAAMASSRRCVRGSHHLRMHWFVTSATGLVTAQQMLGGEFLQLMGRVSGRATIGASPGSEGRTTSSLTTSSGQTPQR